MKIKFLTSGIMIALISVYHPTINADNGNGNNEDSDDDISVIPKEKKGRPKAPSRKNIIYSVENGTLYIGFRKPEGVAEIELLNLTTGISQVFEFDTEIGFRSALPITGTSYLVTIRTEHKNDYIINLDL